MHRIISSELEALFREIVTSGWANESDGNVEAPTGHFAKVTIEDNELTNLVESVFEDNTEASRLEPGYYLVFENELGQTKVYSYTNESALDATYDKLVESFGEWLEKLEG